MISADPTYEDVVRAEDVLARSCQGLKFSDALPGWLAQRAAFYHFYRGLHGSATSEKAALARHIRALEKQEAMARQLAKFKHEALPLRVGQNLELEALEAGCEGLDDMQRRAIELWGALGHRLAVARAWAEQIKGHKSRRGRRPDRLGDDTLLNLIDDFIKNGATAAAARTAAAAVLVAYKFADVPTDERDIRRAENRARERRGLIKK